MITFTTPDRKCFTENEIYHQWQQLEGERPSFPQWLREQVLQGSLVMNDGSRPLTYSWYLKHCRELESQQLRSRIRNQYRAKCRAEGLTPAETDKRCTAFVQSEDYKQQLEQLKLHSRRMQDLQPEAAKNSQRLQRKYWEYCIRRLNLTGMQGLEAESLLDCIDLERSFEAAYQEAVRTIAERLRRALCTQKQYLSVRAGAAFRRRELTAALLPQFPQYYLSHWNARKLADGMDGMDLGTFLREKSMRKVLIRDNEALADLWLRTPKAKREPLVSAVIDRFLAAYPLNKLLEGVSKTFDREQILSLLEQNRLYRRMVQEYQQNRAHYERLEQQILDHIPDNFVEAYPYARAIHRRFFLHIGPTNSGKTYQALQAFREGESGIYLAPLRLLAYEIFERTNKLGVPCDMFTGEEEILVPEAKHISCTIEMLQPENHYAVAVIDEAQMLSDEERGAHWTTAILGVCAEEVHVCAAPNALEILVKLITACGDDYTVLKHERQVPLTAETEPFAFPQSVRPEDALIVFSKSGVLRRAAELQALGIRTSVIYGALPYDVRQEEVRKFTDHETDVVVATDAIGMGLNLPIRRVVFLETQKFDGVKKRNLSNMEVKQIAGRAGRRGLYEIGYYNSAEDMERIVRKYEKPSNTIHHVYVDFPESLLSLDGKLSYLMEQWNAIPDDDVYRKGNITEQLELCSQLEEYSDDKGLIYTFIMIPFTESNRAVRQLWLDLFLVQRDGWSVLPLLEAHLPAEPEGMTLEELELYYQYCDLLFNYCRRFAPEYCRRVTQKKGEISRTITRLLSEQ